MKILDLISRFLYLQVHVCKEGTAAEYGMLAKDDIEEGEVLFIVPRSALLHPGTTKISTLLEKGDCQYKSTSTKTHFCTNDTSLSSSPPREVLCGELVWLGSPAAGSAV